MDAASGGRLQEIAADRAVHQGADLLPVDARTIERLRGRLDAFFARRNIGQPETPLADARHQFQPSLGQSQSRVERFEPRLDLGRGDDLLGQRVGDRFEANVLIKHRQRFHIMRSDVSL